ncbi:TOMM precursor leader peptide-binding protein [Streptacidiphilus sp. NEAU-YB345]|uniref:TOMM leader peptide-binding protein n=1 Tax=Streptacidiphilus fuscans TaxID=2789292 RepID=A0A931B0Z1_9ACTN|nr:TOMM precursor leader peptide-binding protein [Streptacidiphilus fuscans]
MEHRTLSLPSAAAGVGFKPHLRVETVPGEGVYLISAHGVTVLRGTLIATLAPLLDGSRDRERLLADAAALRPALDPERTDEVLTRLSRAGLLTDTAPPRRPLSSTSSTCDAAELAYWELAGLDGPKAARTVAAASVRLLCLGSTRRDEVLTALLAAGLTVLAEDASGEQSGTAAAAGAAAAAAAELTVVACDDYLDAGLARIDAEQRAAGRPWLLFKPSGPSCWIGPVLVPQQNACWHCMAHRLRLNRQPETRLQQLLGRSGPVPHPPSAHPAGAAAAVHLAALEAAKWLGGVRTPHQADLVTLDTTTLESRRHTVVRRPQCPCCGNPTLVADRVTAPVVPLSRPKVTLDGGDHRSASPQQVLDAYGHLVSPVTGAVRELRRDSRGPAFLNCYRAGDNPASVARDHAAVRAGLRTWSSGKGATPLHAKVSALCEALERHSGHYQGDEPVVRASLRELGPDALHPDVVQLFHPRQVVEWYAERNRPGAAARGVFNQLCDPVDEEEQLDWTPVWSLTEQRRRLLPTALLYYRAPQPPGRVVCQATSNGTAAGSSLEDAILQGFLELVERDSVALWWYNRLRRPAVDLAAYTDPWIAEHLTVHRDMGRTVWVLDLTADLGIPVFAAFSARADRTGDSAQAASPQAASPQDIVMGFGAHFDSRVALRRALSESNQMLPAVLDAKDGSGYGCDDPVTLDWFRNATTENQPYLLPDPAAPTRAPADFPYRPRADLRDDVLDVVELLRGHGLELLVLDQTRPDLGIPVAKVIVPGLRPFWARFAAGRLYDVPVRLGWLKAPTRYEDLNPIPFFL